MAAGTGGSWSPLRPAGAAEAFPAEESRLREVKGLAKVTQGHRRCRMGLSGAARPAGSELPGTLTALLVHGQSRARARVQAHSHTHMHTGTCVHGQKAHAPTLILTRAPHTCVCSHAPGNTVHTAVHALLPNICRCTHVCAQHLRMCARMYLYGHPHAHTHRSAHTGVHTFTRRPTTPGLGGGPWELQ